MNNSLKQYIDLHDENLEAINAHSAPQLIGLRDEARQVLENAVLPRKGSDDYEATDLNAALAPDYGVNINHVDLSRESTTKFRCEVPNLSTCLYYVFNDTFRRSATAGQSGDPASVESFQATKHPEVLAKYYGTVARLENTCTALNTMLAQDGVLIYVPKGVATTKPIQLINVFDANARLMAVRRVLIVLEDDAKAKVLVCDHTKGDQQYLSLETVEIVVGRNAQLDYYHMEESDEHTTRLSQLWVRQEEGSNVLIDGITLTNGYTRNDYHIDVDGQHCDTHLLGMAIATGEQHVDNHTLINHNAPRCQSNEMFKYVLNDNSVGAFAGKILVKPDCPKIDAYQGNRNIVAAPTARMYTKPQLEIYTDDVKCSHGATVGQLDQEALFYMQTRGISLPVAQKLLMQAFMSDVIDGVRLDTLRDRLRHLVEMRLSGDSMICESCELKR
ncbi:MAG: Fe-S cluster assembly protein SufD [Muribaculaceae bacterium]|nr:Fe-S cluster assembly protein SufD [Muribaculaceae bacterium]